MLRDPTGDDDTYCRAYRMDDFGNSLFVQHARSVGSCETCSTNGTIVKGLRVTVKGTVESSDDTVPLLMVTEILPDSSGCGGNLTIPSDDIVSCSSGKYINTIRAHGTLMILGWGFLLPSGVIMANLAKHMKNAFWFKYHRANQVLGLCVAFVGWVLALHEFDVFNAGSKNVPFFHGTLGIVIMSIGLLQPVNAFFRPHKHDGQPKSKSRYYWEILHKSCGYLAIVLAVIQILLGISLVSKPNDMVGFQIGYGMIWLVLILLAVGLVIHKRYSKQSPPTTKPQKEIEIFK